MYFSVTLWLDCLLWNYKTIRQFHSFGIFLFIFALYFHFVYCQSIYVATAAGYQPDNKTTRKWEDDKTKGHDTSYWLFVYSGMTPCVTRQPDNWITWLIDWLINLSGCLVLFQRIQSSHNADNMTLKYRWKQVIQLSGWLVHLESTGLNACPLG